jgi:GNAT superfamily N-acetyltransferase
MQYTIATDRTLAWPEFSDLMQSVGWSGYDEQSFLRASSAYPLVVHARNTEGQLIGYLTAFSDGAFSTILGELVVHPDAQRASVGKALLSVVETTFPDVPIYVKALGDSKHFYEACGYRLPRKEMTVLFKRPSAIN